MMTAHPLLGQRMGWLAHAWQRRPASAPYPSDLIVTPRSMFKDDTWLFPENWLPPGSEDRNRLPFLGSSRHSGGLIRGEDDVLIDQLKEATFALMYHRAAIRGPDRKAIVRPRTIEKEFYSLRRFFHALKKMSVTSISAITPQIAHAIVEEESANTSSNSLIDFIDKIEITIHASRSGFISEPVPNGSFLFSIGARLKDTSIERGAQPLTEGDVAEIISSSIFLIENSGELLELLEAYQEGDRTFKKDIVDFSGLKYPMFDEIQVRFFPWYVISFLQIASFHLIGFYLGMRPSEFLSARTGCISNEMGSTVIVSERMTLLTTTIKNSKKMYGHARYFPIHPYLARVYRVVENLRSKYYKHSDRIFINPHSGKTWSGNNLTALLNNFNARHGIDRRMTTYVWRKTLVAVTIHVRDKPLDLLREIMGHSDIGESAGYAHSSPFIKKELEAANRTATSKAIAQVVDASKALGGPGIGGRQGKLAEKKLAGMTGGKHEISFTSAEIADAAVDAGITPTQVRKNVDCFKPINQVGRCALAANDLLPDIENCSALCPFRVETDDEYQAVTKRVSEITTMLSNDSLSVLERARWARDLQDQLTSWPELLPDFENVLLRNSNLRRWFVL